MDFELTIMNLLLKMMDVFIKNDRIACDVVHKYGETDPVSANFPRIFSPHLAPFSLHFTPFYSILLCFLLNFVLNCQARAMDLLKPRTIATSEGIIPSPTAPAAKPWSRFNLGVSIDKLFVPPPTGAVPAWAAASLVKRLLSVHQKEKYILGADASSLTV